MIERRWLILIESTHGFFCVISDFYTMGSLFVYHGVLFVYRFIFHQLILFKYFESPTYLPYRHFITDLLCTIHYKMHSRLLQLQTSFFYNHIFNNNIVTILPVIYFVFRSYQEYIVTKSRSKEDNGRDWLIYSGNDEAVLPTSLFVARESYVAVEGRI